MKLSARAFAERVRGGVAGLGDGVQRTLGRGPHSVEDFAADQLAPAVRRHLP
ncbi:hypothetical protein [Streptosporangium saharense]|uniref:hypothetical protein n=1 Tax=Streptosporangium saharense TaxID=1706840 RepID=UPI00332AF847